ncbi:creatininase family protein [Streptomyces wedmorensis]
MAAARPALQHRPRTRLGPGTLSLTITEFTTLLHTLVAQYIRATKARHLVLANGHGGNRGVLSALVYELRHAHEINVCLLHPLALAHLPAGTGRRSTSAATRPRLCSTSSLSASTSTNSPPPAPGRRRDPLAGHRPGVSWPWTSNDPRIAAAGVIGNDPRTATPALGAHLLDMAVAAAVPALEALTERKSPRS